jgi:hypothetical protein
MTITPIYLYVACMDVGSNGQQPVTKKYDQYKYVCKQRKHTPILWLEDNFCDFAIEYGCSEPHTKRLAAAEEEGGGLNFIVLSSVRKVPAIATESRRHADWDAPEVAVSSYSHARPERAQVTTPNISKLNIRKK